MNKSLFPGISFLRIIFNVIIFPNIQIIFFPFTRKPYAKFQNYVKYLRWGALLIALSGRRERGGTGGTPAPRPFPGPKYFFPRKIGNIKFVDVKNIN